MFIEKVIEAPNGQRSSTNRSIVSYVKGEQWEEAVQLYMFGVRKGLDYVHVDDYERNLLHYLADNGDGLTDAQTDLIDIICEKNHELINQGNSDGDTPLHDWTRNIKEAFNIFDALI